MAKPKVRKSKTKQKQKQKQKQQQTVVINIGKEIKRRTRKSMGGSGRPKPLNQYYGTPQTPILYNMHNVGADLLFRDVIQPMKIKQQKEQALQRADREELRLSRLKKFERITPSLGSLEEMPKQEPNLEPVTPQVETPSKNFNEMYDITGDVSTPTPKKSLLKSFLGRKAASVRPDGQTPGTAEPRRDPDALPSASEVPSSRGRKVYHADGKQARGTGTRSKIPKDQKGKFENDIEAFASKHASKNKGGDYIVSYVTASARKDYKELRESYPQKSDSGLKSSIKRSKDKIFSKGGVNSNLTEVGESSSVDLLDNSEHDTETGQLNHSSDYYEYGESKSDDDTI